jgi:integrase
MDRLLTFAPIADVPINTITGETVSRYARYRQEVPKNSVVTVNGDLRTLRRVLHLAEEWGRLDRIPAIHELPQSKGRDRVLSFEEEAKYLAKASENLRDAAILAVDTGMRPNSELFPLKWADVDLTERPESPHGIIHVRQGKTDSAQRSLPLTPRVAEVLSRRKNAAEAKARKSAFVFPGAGIGGHITSVQHPHKAAIEDAKLETFEFYCWRHTFGTRASQSGMDRFIRVQPAWHLSKMRPLRPSEILREGFRSSWAGHFARQRPLPAGRAFSESASCCAFTEPSQRSSERSTGLRSKRQDRHGGNAPASLRL